MADQLKFMFSDVKLEELSDAIRSHYSSFDKKKFLGNFRTKTWKDAALKARVRIISTAIHSCLPKNYREAIDILIPLSKMNWGGFFGIVFPDYVEQFGREDWKTSMRALEEFTKTSSAEFAIRPFIVAEQSGTMQKMMTWSKSGNLHLRRLSSEGCRPRLPWGMRLQRFVVDPSPILPILENLKSDTELYVRKSVANNLNDISKDHPDLVLKIAEKWYGKNDHTDWIIQHGLRTLLKSGNKRALKIFGHHDIKGLEVTDLELNKKKLMQDEVLKFSFRIKNTSKRSQDCRIEYAIDFQKSNGSLSRKIFQITKTSFGSGTISFSRTHKFNDLTTRKHYAGLHKIHILVNGEIMASAEFNLVMKSI